MKNSERYFYGASYSPLMFAEQDWERDLRHMADASMNLIRVGDVHGSWDRIEPVEGQFRLDILERFYQAADKHGIQIIMTNGASCPPLWLAKKYPDLPLLSNRGQRYPLGASYHWACIHHPGFIEALKKYTQTLIDFVLSQPNHFGWQITNEIGFPFLPAREEKELGLYCYCEHCQAKFRDWAKEKYQNPDELTHSWSWGTTNYHYNNWEDVFAPESLPSAWAGVTKWIDWRLFWQDMFADFAGWQHDLIAATDPDHPTSVNTFNFKGYDRFGTFMGLDQWKIAKRVDHIGYDIYPGSGNKLVTRPEHSSLFLDHGRSVANSVGSAFWLHEVESGPIGGWVMGPDYNTSAVDIWRNGIEALGHDVKLMLYQPWREWDYQPLHWGALVDLDGDLTPRYEAAKTLGTYIQENESFLMSAKVPQGEVALLESKPNAIFFRGVAQEDELFLAQRGAYRAFWELGYDVDFITPEQVLTDISRYKVVVLPLMGLIDQATAQALSTYVENGGILVGFARCGTLTGAGWYHHKLPIPGLREAFGIDRVEPDRLMDLAIDYNGRKYAGWRNRDIVAPAQGTQVLATFANGQPAVTLAKHGKGYGLYLATQADAGHLKCEDKLLKSVISELTNQFALQPRLQVEFTGRTHRELDPHILESDQQATVLISNYLKQDTGAQLRVRLDGRAVKKVVQVLPVSKDIEWSLEENYLVIPLSFHAEEVSILNIFWD
jgi:beta-galactosidase GanA